MGQVVLYYYNTYPVLLRHEKDVETMRNYEKHEKHEKHKAFCELQKGHNPLRFF